MVVHDHYIMISSANHRSQQDLDKFLSQRCEKEIEVRKSLLQELKQEEGLIHWIHSLMTMQRQKYYPFVHPNCATRILLYILVNRRCFRDRDYTLSDLQCLKHVQDPDGTLLKWACLYRWDSVIKFLILCGSNVHGKHDRLFHILLTRRDWYQLLELILPGCKKLDNWLIKFCETYNPNLQWSEMHAGIELLREHGANINAEEGVIFINACTSSDYWVPYRYHLLNYLIAAGIDVNTRNYDALRTARLRKDVKLIQYLTQNGCESGADDKFLFSMQQ